MSHNEDLYFRNLLISLTDNYKDDWVTDSGFLDDIANGSVLDESQTLAEFEARKETYDACKVDLIFTIKLVYAQSLTALKSTLNNGLKIPSVGLGTSKMSNIEARRAVIDAIQVGYRHIDTAFYYDNEIGVGIGIDQLINDYKMNREKLFVTTKIWGNFHERERAVLGLKISLKKLGLDYVDLVLIHWPTGFKPQSDCGFSYAKYSNGSDILRVMYISSCKSF